MLQEARQLEERREIVRNSNFDFACCACVYEPYPIIADVLRKHPARKPSQRENDIYINRTSDFGAQMARCRKLIDSG